MNEPSAEARTKGHAYARSGVEDINLTYVVLQLALREAKAVIEESECRIQGAIISWSERARKTACTKAGDSQRRNAKTCAERDDLPDWHEEPILKKQEAFRLWQPSLNDYLQRCARQSRNQIKIAKSDTRCTILICF